LLEVDTNFWWNTLPVSCVVLLLVGCTEVVIQIQGTGNGSQSGATEMVNRNLKSTKLVLIRDLNSYVAEGAWNIVMFLFAQAALHQP
jgi:hypothetical protein